MQASHCLVFDAFRLDLHDERLWRGQEVIHLHPKTFAVLCCLVTQAGQLVTKDALLVAVWPETAVSESVVTVAIRELRRMLGDRARTPGLSRPCTAGGIGSLLQSRPRRLLKRLGS
jgi:DNA-binding winged helix-turn-helix (wHTH) protein